MAMLNNQMVILWNCRQNHANCNSCDCQNGVSTWCEKIWLSPSQHREHQLCVAVLVKPLGAPGVWGANSLISAGSWSLAAGTLHQMPTDPWLLVCRLMVPVGYGSIPINTIFRGMNIHLPAILMFTRGTRFWHTASWTKNPPQRGEAPSHVTCWMRSKQFWHRCEERLIPDEISYNAAMTAQVQRGCDATNCGYHPAISLA